MAGDLVKRKYSVEGKLDDHTFDVVVSKNRPYFAAQGLSFELTNLTMLQKDVDATAWAIDDVKNNDPGFPIAILALPPVVDQVGLFKRAKKLFKGLDTDVLESDAQMGKWVGSLARKIPDQTRSHRLGRGH